MRELPYVINTCAECPNCTLFRGGVIICKLLLFQEGKTSWVLDTIINQKDVYYLSRNVPPADIPEKCPLPEHHSLIGEV